MKKLLELCTVVALILTVTTAKGNLVIPHGTLNVDGVEIAFYKQGSPVTLPAPGDYDWRYGCSPTSAGMIMGHYDVHGYQGQSYDNLVPGGQAENSTFGNPGALVNRSIASHGYQEDFYDAATYGYDTGGGPGHGYGNSGDDVTPPWHSFDCLADFMGTSQDSCGNSNGSTTFYYFSNGAPFTASDALNYGVSSLDGMYGIGEYLEYAGYDATVLYTQRIYTPSAPLGFTFSQYVAEINAGRPVIIQVEGHSMYGYGYDSANNTVLLHDTWTLGQHSMTWGGSYSGMLQWGVVALTPIPEPATICLLGLGALSLIRRKRSV